MDNGLSRRRQGFKSPWGRQQEIKAPAVMQVPFFIGVLRVVVIWLFFVSLVGPPSFPLKNSRVLHKECYNGILQLRSSLCNTVQNVRQSGL